MESVKVVISNDQKAVKVPTGIRLLIRRCCHAVLELEHFEGSAEVSVRFVDNEQIRELNKAYRNIDRETDVLSFPLGENGVYDINHDTGAKLLGDIVISMEKAMEQADNGDYGALGEILARAMIDNLNRFIIPNLAGPAKLVPLASLVDDDMTLVALRAAAQRGRLEAHQGSDGQWLSTRKAVTTYKKSRRQGARRTPREEDR